MERQLALIETPAHQWRLDETTRARGRRGVEAARAALRHAAPPESHDAPREDRDDGHDGHPTAA